MRKRISIQAASLFVCAACAMLATSQVAWATSMEPDQVLTEVMINSQEGILEALGEAFGPDPASVLAFTSTMNFSSNTFSFSATAGDTYQGRSFAYTATGSMDSLGNTTESGSGSIGSFAIASSGTGLLSGDPEYDIQGTVEINNVQYKRVGKTLITFNSPTESSVVLQNVGTGKKYHGSDTAMARPGGLKYTWGIESDPIPDQNGNLIRDPQGFKIDVQGLIDEPSGMGSFDATIAPIPEPSSVWMALSGTVLLGIAMVSRLHGQASTA